ncbi:MAG: phosphoglycerate mutase (2,3-diphosphoglycerate-independent) [Anaerolineae bacterium]|jgi:2,3-bisphosphoglycerate-independent phosphoglycerate mutase
MSRTPYPLAEAVRRAYQGTLEGAPEDDETMEPLVRVDACGRPMGRISDGDYVIFYDLRGEREIELTQAFVEQPFGHFATEPIDTHWVTLIEYQPNLAVRVAFPPEGPYADTLCEAVSRAGLSQVKIVESEKAVHLAYFLNGKRETPFPGERRRFLPSREFEGYLPPPEMRAAAVADATMQEMHGNADLIIVNWANVDVIGHSEDRGAILRAVETVDAQLARVLAAARSEGIIAVVTADHGTVEKWLYEDGTIDTGHTDSPVPLAIVGDGLDQSTLRQGGTLIDVAPTVLALLGLPIPTAMEGRPLLQHAPTTRRHRVALLILDGWGARDERAGNLIAEAHTPCMDALSRQPLYTRLEAAGEAVGLPETVPGRPGKTVGNSEVGHLHLGAGRVVPSDRLRVERAIADGSLLRNQALRWAMEGAIRDRKALHLLGIISFYSSHGSVEHLLALLRMAHELGVPEVYIHGMLGRRGEKPESGAIYTQQVEEACEALGTGAFVSLIGRFWSLDREHNWDRIEKSYRWLVHGEGRPVRPV